MKEKKLTVKTDERELELWKEAAYSRRVSLSEWVRRTLTANAEQTTGKKEDDGICRICDEVKWQHKPGCSLAALESALP